MVLLLFRNVECPIVVNLARGQGHAVFFGRVIDPADQTGNMPM
jgi:hypothetical protein